MHHKVIVIDGQIVVTGSYNFSRSAQEYNDENVLIIHDVATATRFLLEFERIFSTAEP
jgi:phosphatidylserine/phosphatidylglycerophosphate/cardiolipin synthase-like enzyme